MMVGGAPLQPVPPFLRERSKQRVAFDKLRLSGPFPGNPIPLGLSLSKPAHNFTIQV